MEVGRITQLTPNYSNVIAAWEGGVWVEKKTSVTVKTDATDAEVAATIEAMEKLDKHQMSALAKAYIRLANALAEEEAREKAEGDHGQG